MDNRAPKNMQDLLKFAIQYQQNNEKDLVEMDEDKKIFLDNVLQSMTVNVMEELLKAVRILQCEASSDEEKVDALDSIRDYIDNIDFANSFIKIEGADILINCIKHTNKSICIGAISIVAEMAQNNTFGQQYFLKQGIIEVLIKCLSNDDSELVASALYALSSLIRNFEPALMEFIQKEGIKHVNKCLDIECSRSFAKSCFLIASISSEFCLVKDEFAKLGTFNKLIKKLRVVNGYEADVEMILRTMTVLSESRFCKTSEEEIKYIIHIVKNIIKENENLPECEEIVVYSNSLLRAFQCTDELNNKNNT